MDDLLKIELDSLNSIQDEWMKLSPSASEDEKTRVFELMKKLPSSYITGKDDRHNIMLNGSMPLYASSQPIDVVKQTASEHGIRTDISWDCAGKWIAV